MDVSFNPQSNIILIAAGRHAITGLAFTEVTLPEKTWHWLLFGDFLRDDNWTVGLENRTVPFPDLETLAVRAQTYDWGLMVHGGYLNRNHAERRSKMALHNGNDYCNPLTGAYGE
jgi:hypothetical protein